MIVVVTCSNQFQNKNEFFYDLTANSYKLLKSQPLRVPHLKNCLNILPSCLAESPSCLYSVQSSGTQPYYFRVVVQLQISPQKYTMAYIYLRVLLQWLFECYSGHAHTHSRASRGSNNEQLSPEPTPRCACARPHTEIFRHRENTRFIRSSTRANSHM